MSKEKEELGYSEFLNSLEEQEIEEQIKLAKRLGIAGEPEEKERKEETDGKSKES